MVIAVERPKSGPPGSSRSSAMSAALRSGCTGSSGEDAPLSARDRNLRFRRSPRDLSVATPISVEATLGPSSRMQLPRAYQSSWSSSSRPTSTPLSSIGSGMRELDIGASSRGGVSLYSDHADWPEVPLGPLWEGSPRPSSQPNRTTWSAHAASRHGGAGGVVVYQQQKADLVAPPWGSQRANLDQPPIERKMERQQQYQQLLEKQLEATKEKNKNLQGERKELAATSLKMTEALAGYETSFRQIQGANFKDLAQSVKERQEKRTAARQEELKDYQKWAMSSEKEQAMLYEAQQTRRKEEWVSLANDWQKAAADKEEKRRAERKAALQAEVEVNRQLSQGLVPPRRMKRGQPTGWPRQPLAPRQGMMTPRSIARA